jgi:hypothetical protein
MLAVDEWQHKKSHESEEQFPGVVSIRCFLSDQIP